MSLFQLALLGALIGLPLGYAFQRSQLCFNRAYREVVLHKNTVMLRMIALAIVVQMVGLAILVQFQVGGVKTNIVPFWWLGAMVGGLAFGFSMVFAQGCSSAVWYRLGNGNIGALITLIGFALGEWMLRFGFLRGILRFFQQFEIRLPSGALSTLPNSLGISPWLLIIPLAAAMVWVLFRSQGGRWGNGWDWRKAGLILGVIGTAAWIVSWPTGWSYGVGVVGGTGEIVEMFRSGPQVLNWGSFFVLSLPVGALVAAWRKGELRWQVPEASAGARRLLAGFAMGMSAAIAGGCNIGHGFSGVPTLALSSLTATLFTFLGAWLGNILWFQRSARVPLSEIRSDART